MLKSRPLFDACKTPLEVDLLNARTLAVALALAALVTLPVASAHKTTYTPEGNVKIVWGFLGEPAVTMTKTGLDLGLTDNATGAPILGAQETLRASLVFGEERHDFSLRAQFGSPGKYTDVVTLSRPGLYSLHLNGTLNGTAVDMTIPAAHDVEAIEETYFPSMEHGDADLAAKVAALEAKVAALEAKATAQSQTPATTSTATGGNDAPGFGALAALAAVGLALVLLRRRA